MANIRPFSIDALFEPVRLGSLSLRNRIAMAPMTRGFASGGVPDATNAEYYRRRVEGGVGLIISEGTFIGHRAAGHLKDVPWFDGEAALAGWKTVVDTVHAAGGRIFPQLWHMGNVPISADVGKETVRTGGPSGLVALRGFPAKVKRSGDPMPDAEISDVIDAYGRAAEAALRLDFDGIEIHAAHGYLIDQFFWNVTNKRRDRFGGPSIGERTRFAVEILRECRRRVGPDFPISFRFSQWKTADYEAVLFDGPAELESFLEPLVLAGVNIFHCSTRRYWVPAFEGSLLGLAGWTRKLSGKAVITVGSVGLSNPYRSGSRLAGNAGLSTAESIEPLMHQLERGEFDLVAVGRALIANPDWPDRIRRPEPDLAGFDPAALETLH